MFFIAVFNMSTKRNKLIRQYFLMGLRHCEIQAYLSLQHDFDLSIRQIKRVLNKEGFYRRTYYTPLRELLILLAINAGILEIYMDIVGCI